jgi:trimeric autotransporter adhesin
MQIQLSLRRILAGLCGLMALAFATHPLTSQSTGPQQLVFAGLLGSTNPNPSDPANAQFNAVQSDASGNIYLLLDQKDGVRLLKTDSTATNVLAQTQLGAAGDIGLAMALDPSGKIYITGTTTSLAAEVLKQDCPSHKVITCTQSCRTCVTVCASFTSPPPSPSPPSSLSR